MRAATIASVGNGRSRHGAVIIKGGSVLNVGINRSRTGDTWITDRPRNTCSIHAEIAAMRACGDVRGATLYVARVNKRDGLRPSAPCQNCRREIELRGLKKVVHS